LGVYGPFTLYRDKKVVGGVFITFGGTIDCLVPVSDNLFIGNEIEFEAHISFNQPLNWVNCV
jgi:hypothetical protein